MPAIPVSWCGGLGWDLPPDRLLAFAREHAGWGYGVRTVDRAEAADIEPNLASPPKLAVHVAAEGAVEPARAACALLEHANPRRRPATHGGAPARAAGWAGQRPRHG